METSSKINKVKTVKPLTLKGQYRAKLRNDLESLWDTDLSYTEIGKMYNLVISDVCKVFQEKYDATSRGLRTKRINKVKQAERWSKYESKEDTYDGYKKARGADKHFFNEHVAVYCKAHGLTALPKGYVIHHINRRRRDNRLENLEMLTYAEHRKRHLEEDGHWMEQMRSKWERINTLPFLRRCND